MGHNKQLEIMLRYHRKEKDLSAKDVCEQIYTNYGIKVSPKTVYAWEQARICPSVDTIVALCDYYNIEDSMEEFGYKKDGRYIVNGNTREHPVLGSNGTEPKISMMVTVEEKSIIEAMRQQHSQVKNIRKLLDMDK